jgi:hypothetical protein
MKCLDRTDNLQGISITGPNPELNYKAEPSEGAMLNQLYIKSESDAFRTTFGEPLTGLDMVLSDEQPRIQSQSRGQTASMVTSSVLHPSIIRPRPKKQSLSYRRASETVRFLKTQTFP